MSSSSYSNYRWVILVLGILASLGQCVMWLSPAPLLSTIAQDLKVGLGQAGILLTIITLFTGIFIFAGSFVIDKLGLKKAIVISLFVMGIGGILSVFARSFAFIFMARLLVGVGSGLMAPVIGALIMAWFSPKEQPYINTVIAALSYVGMTLAFLITIPIFMAVKTWQNTLATFGAYTFLVAIFWLVFGRAYQTAEALGEDKEFSVESNQIQAERKSGLRQAAKRKEVWFIAIAMIGAMWTFNTFTTFLPAYFEKIRGYDIAGASNLTSFLPMVGIFGGFLCGIATGALGLRKPFLWPLMVLILVGAIGSIIIPSGPLLYLCIGLIGLGSAGWSPVFMTILMEIEKATPEMVGGAFAIILGSGFFVSYFVPFVFSALVPTWGMRSTMLLFGLSTILSIVSLFLIPETGPKARKKPA